MISGNSGGAPVRMGQFSFSVMSVSILTCFSSVTRSQTTSQNESRRNVIIFVSDGMRHGSVSAEATPTLWAVRTQGVYFQNSHSLFPTFTTANASAIATGHGLGDTGDFSNTIWTGYPIFEREILAW